MAEAIPITPSPAVAMMPAASGAPVAAGVAAEGIFAGMLAQRLQPVAEAGGTMAEGGPPVTPAATNPLSAAATRPPASDPSAGQESPQVGNALPVGEAVALPLVDGLPPDPDLPLSALDGLTPPTAAEGVVASTGPLAGSAQALLQDSDGAKVPVSPLADGSLPSTAGMAPAGMPAETPRSLASPAGNPQDRPANGHPLPARPPSTSEPQMDGLKPGQLAAAQQPSPGRPVSLGANTAVQPGEAGQAHVAGLTEQGQKGVPSPPASGSFPNGETLSRQFRQQMDRLRAITHAAAGGSTATVPAAAPDSSPVVPLDQTVGHVSSLPGIGGDFRVPTPLPVTQGLPVATVVGQPGWSAELGQRMVWLANQEVREAQIQLNPRHLGPIDVRIVYSDAQQLSVSFVAHNPVARDALDAALPRLREMFDQQGLTLADASVSQESFADRHDADGGAHDNDGLPSAAAWPERVVAGHDDGRSPATPRIVGVGLIDAFA